MLAHHCANAGQTEKASLLLGRAGQQSFARWAMREAAEQLSRALGQIATLPGTAALRGEQIKLKVALANALAHLKGYAAPETRTSLDRARSLIERAEALGEPPEDPLLLWRPTTSPRTAVRPAMTPRSLKRSASASSAVKASGPLCRSRDAGQSTVFRWLASNQEFRQLSWTGTEVVYSN